MSAALRALRDRAEAFRGTGPLGFDTDSTTDPTRVAIAISTPERSFVFTVEKAEYDGTKLMPLLGFPTETTAAEVFDKAKKAKKETKRA